MRCDLTGMFWQVQIDGIVRDLNNLGVSVSRLPTELEWGQVLVNIKYAAVNPADLYTIRTGNYGFETAQYPHYCGHDAIGVVAKVPHVLLGCSKHGLSLQDRTWGNKSFRE